MSVMVLLKINEASHQDIRERIGRLGLEYVRDFIDVHPQHGFVIKFGEVGLVVDPDGPPVLTSEPRT